MKPHNMPREHRLNLRLNEHEKAVIDRAATIAGTPPGTFGRQSILDAAQKRTSNNLQLVKRP